jgi:tRNA-dihydrouridine synthase A
MMDWSDRHCRYFWRLLSQNALMYTEMVTTGALIHGDRERFLHYDAAEHPLALQLGGSDPEDLAQCARWAADAGYIEANLNCGCPSDRVQNGAFGACLMATPELVRDCVQAMNETGLRITVKHRIGIDDMDSYDEFRDFVATVAEGGCDTFIVHARKAWLQGLSPKENREIPPLNYPWVYRLKKELPSLSIVINGGIETIEDCKTHLEHVDGVMLGRAAYHHPWLLSEVDAQLFATPPPHHSRERIIEALLPYIEQELSAGTRLNQITRHLLGLYQQVPGARRFRRVLSERAHRPGAGTEVLMAALAEVTDRAA